MKQKATAAVAQSSFLAQALFCLPFQAEGSLTSSKRIFDKYRITCFPISVYLLVKAVNCLIESSVSNIIPSRPAESRTRDCPAAGRGEGEGEI